MYVTPNYYANKLLSSFKGKVISAAATNMTILKYSIVLDYT